MRTRTLAALAALTVLAAGCTGTGDDGPADGGGTAAPTENEERQDGGDPPGAEGSAEVTGTVAEGLDSPWGLVALPDGDLLVTSRDEGIVWRVDAGSGDAEEAGPVPGVSHGGEGGLLGLAAEPEFEDGGWLYAYLTAADDNRIVRMEYARDTGLGEPEVVLEGIPRGDAVHQGGRLAFGPDGMLYAATGDAGEPALAQDEDSLAGKILRMTPEGEVPEDGNPDPGSVVYSLGHRNVQGLAWDDRDRLWATEFGADAWDELNEIEPGGNYGWPEHEGSGGEADGYLDPAVEWPPSEASPSGLTFTQGSLWMATLRGERLWRIPLDGTGPMADPQAFFEGEYGRLRSVLAVGPDELLLLTNETDTRGAPGEGDDRILRLTVS
ncbi:PQQ-dependent sugar dehydrogenase [Streptomyces sodiiphilus]|uniref:PQQ-dependent sugar dehydrogenase n=1 Tax=Streptomyces sodiiphilus TaxID=226217 RepID=A0ABN2P6T8_9ACTN